MGYRSGAGYQRYPVQDPQSGACTGIVTTTDVLAAEAVGDTSAGVRTYMRAPRMIPGNMPLDEILPRMRLLQQPMCLVADDQGNVIGLITTTDVFEEIVGEL